MMQQDSVRIIFSSREFNTYCMRWMGRWMDGKSLGAQMFEGLGHASLKHVSGNVVIQFCLLVPMKAI